MKHSNIVYFSLILLFVISSCGNRSANNSSIYSFDTPTIDVEDSITVRDTVRNVSSLMFQNTGIYDTTYRHTSDSLLAIRHKGIIVKGKSSTDSHKDKGMFYLPVNEQYQYIEGGKNSDIVFEFYLPDGFKSSDSIILSYKLKGAHDFTSLSKKINNSSVVGGMYFKRDTSWSLQREELPYFALKKGKNIFRYELPNGVSDIVAIKDIQLNIISKNKRGDCVIVNQPDNRCFYRTFGYLQGFIDSEAKLSIDGKPIATDKGFFETIVHRKTVVGDSWLSTLEVLYPNGKKIRKEVQFVCSTDYDFSSTKGTYSQRIEQTITPDNGFDISILGARLTGEKGGVATSRNLSITALRSIDMSVVSSDIINVTAEAAGYRFLPSGLKFDTMHIMAMSYEPKLIPQGYTADDVFTFYYDEQTQRWQRIERSRVDTVNHIIYSYTDHFTDYINGILKAPELPDVQAYVPTTIKDLQAAHPHTGIGSFSVPEANNKGTANTSMPLWVPAGRNGLQPNLILAYNSAGGNGWLGQGWDILISSIEVETRWGVPLYDTDYETETYLLDGTTLLLSRFDKNNNIVLVEPTYRRNFDKRIMDSLRLYREIEGAFQKIVRYGNSPSEYYFVVTDKNGTKMTYGNDGSSDNVCEQKDQIGNKAKWLLTKIEDANGNWMKFSYQTKSYQGGSNIYIKDIEYTGNGNEGGNYLISFKLSNAIRPDVMSNGRKGLFEVSAHLLDRVDVIYKASGEFLRQYYFGYQKGAYGKTLLSNMLEVDGTFRNDENIGIFIKSDIFDRNATRESAKNYYPIKYYFSYHGGDMKYSEDRYVTSNYDTPPFTYIANNIVNNVFGNLSSIKPGSLGGSTTSAWGAGGAFSVGFDWLAALRTFSAGGKFDYNRESGESFLTLVDLNGDGYPDKLFKKDGVLCYRLCELNNNKPHSFGDIHRIDNVQDFNQATNSSHIFGIEAQAGFSRRIGCSFGADLSYARSSTNVYLSDVDGDGLVDIVDNNRGKVFFNRIKYGQGFKDQTNEEKIRLPEASCNVYVRNDKPVNLDVFKSGIPDTIEYEICVPKMPHIKCEHCKQLYDQKKYRLIMDCEKHYNINCMTVKKIVYEADKELHVPDIESVKAWIAPYDGEVAVESWAMLTDYLRNKRLSNNIMDGVTVSIQKSSVSAQHTSNNQPEILMRKTIFPFKYFDIAGMRRPHISVNKGDILYFRVQSNEKHALDILKWEIQVHYPTYGTSFGNPCFRDSFIYRNGKDFILNGKQEIDYIFNGNIGIECEIRVDSGYSLGQYPLVLKSERYQKNNNGNTINYSVDTLLETRQYAGSGSIFGTKNISISGVVDSNINTHRFGRFYLDCEDKGIDWTKVDAKVRVYYRHISDAIPGSNPPIPITPIKEIIGYDTIYNVEYRPVVEKKCLQYAKQPSFRLDSYFDIYKIQLEWEYEDGYEYFPNPLVNDTLTVIVRDSNGHIWHLYQVPVIDGDIQIINLNSRIKKSVYFYIDVYAPGIAGTLAKNMTATLMGYYGHYSSYNRVGLYANYSHKYIPNKRYSRFGSIYRGWTQFGYKPADKFSPYIDENLLNTDYLDSIQQGGQTSYIPNTTDTIVIPANFSDASILSSQNGKIKTFDPLRYNFFPMNADASSNRYVAYGGAYMVKDTMSNTITDQLVAVAEDESFPVSSESWDTSYYDNIEINLRKMADGQDNAPNCTAPPTLAKTVKKRTNTYNIVNLRGNASFAGLGHGLTYSHSNSKLVSDYMDMNGDRYPDILGDQAIQYSKQQGGLSDKIVRFNSSDMYDIDVSVSNAIGSGVSGSKNHVISEQAICSSAKKSVVKVKSRGGSVGEGIALAWNDNKATWQDINGDGLPDRIIDKDTVRVAYINLGYSFTNPIKLKNAVMRKSTSVSLNKSIGGGGGNSLNVYNQCVGNGSGTPNSFDVALSFSGGLSRSGSLNHMKRTFMDVNGDGLADIVEYVNPALPVEDLASNISPIQFDISNLTNDRVVVYYNNGSGFTSRELLKAENTGIDESVSSNFGGNIAGSMGFTIGFLPIKFVGTVSGYKNWGANNEIVKLMDFNNDGYPDFVRVSPNDNTKIIVNYAEPSATNLLASIEMPTNMRVDINYTLTERSTVDNPFRYWNMTECKRSLFEKVNVYSYLNRFEYHNRRYNRSQREDGGYKTVVTKIMTNQIQNNNGGIVIGIQNSALSVNENNIAVCNTDKESHELSFNTVYMTITDTYSNDASIFRGLHTDRELKDYNGILISTERNMFSQYDIKSGREKTPNDLCLGSVYPALKGVYLLTYEKEPSEPLKTLKEYSYKEYGNVKSYRTAHSSGGFVEATFNYHNREKPYIVGTVSDITYRASNSNITYRRTSKIDSRGNISEINNNGAISNYYFDRYGNTTDVVFPANGNGERKSVTIDYDNVLKALPVSVYDMEGYESTTAYDYRYQVPIRTTDIGGSVMLYSYDTKGRLKSVKTPKDPVYTVKYQYWDTYDMSKYIQNGAFADYRRSVYKWVETSHYNVDYPSMPMKTVVFADAFGRIDATVKFIDFGDGRPRRAAVYGGKCYDAVGNVLREYTEPLIVDSAHNNSGMLQGVYPTNDNEIPVWYTDIHSIYAATQYWYGKYRSYTRDEKGRAVAIREPDGTVSRMAYAIDRGLSKTSMTDALGNTSHVWRDARGQTVKAQSPMGAVTQFQYDGLGELRQTIDPEGYTTLFYYDELGRIRETSHPSRGITEYLYDGATSNVAVEYNPLGKIEYQYDILGRQIAKRYSDNPQNNVFYQYGPPSGDTNSGRLVKVQDATGVTEYKYGSMGEVELEMRTHILFGEGITYLTEWKYDSWGRTRKILYPDGEEVHYRYNKTGLLSKVESNTNGYYITDMYYNGMEQKEKVSYGNGTYAEYKYDSLMYRPTNYILRRGIDTIFSKNYDYNSVGNVEYQQDFYKFANIGYDIYNEYRYDADNRLYYAMGKGNDLDYKLEMQYSPSGKIQYKNLNSIGIKNGNIMNIQYQNPYQYNKTDNPYAVTDIEDFGNGHRYSYCWDAAGNMTYACHIGKPKTSEMYFWTEDNRMQAYAAKEEKNDLAYYRYDHTGKREMKLLGNLLDVYNMGEYEYLPYFSDMVLYAGDLMTFDKQGIKKHYFVEGERFLTNCGSEGHPSVDPLKSLKGIEPKDLIDMSKNFENNIISYFTAHKYSDCRDTNIRESKIDELLMYRYKEFADILRDNQKPESYYLHTDRLGSGSAVTDGRGEAVHVLGYMPYGETLLDLSHTHYETPYQFTGYEKDQETGLHYAGARYYDSRLSIFNSTDPMWHKYPHLSPYAYSADNPVMLVDPDGMEIEPVYDLKGNHLGNTKEGFKGKIILYGGDKRDFSSMTVADVYKLKSNDVHVSNLNEGYELSEDAYSKIYTNVLEQIGYPIHSLKGSKINVKNGYLMSDKNIPRTDVTASAIWTKNTLTEVTVYQKSNNIRLLNTVENIENMLVGHEADGHGKHRNYNEVQVIEFQMKHKSWLGTTSIFKTSYENELVKQRSLLQQEADLNKMIRQHLRRK